MTNSTSSTSRNIGFVTPKKANWASEFTFLPKMQGRDWWQRRCLLWWQCGQKQQHGISGEMRSCQPRPGLRSAKDILRLLSWIAFSSFGFLSLRVPPSCVSFTLFFACQKRWTGRFNPSDPDTKRRKDTGSDQWFNSACLLQSCLFLSLYLIIKKFIYRVFLFYKK